MPDARGWAGIGLFVTFLYVFTVRSLLPALTKDETTNVLLGGLATGGVLLVASYYFGSSSPKDKPPQ
jgi:hypothetical protein